MSIRTLTFTIFLLLWAAVGTALSQSQILIIDRAPSQGPDARFRIQFGTNAGVVNSWLDLGTNDTVQLTNGPWGRVFACAVQVVTNPPPFEQTVIGPPSNELVFTNRPSAPMRLRIGTNTASIRIEGTTDGENWIHLATGIKDATIFRIPSATDVMLFRTVSPPSP